MAGHKLPAHELSHLWNKAKPSAAVKNVQLWNCLEHLSQPKYPLGLSKREMFIFILFENFKDVK